jgi:hypothetical protein
MSRPRDLTEIAQKNAARVEKLRQEIGLAGRRLTPQRARNITAHGKTQPARQNDRCGEAPPLRQAMEDTPSRQRWNKCHNARVDLVRSQCTRPCYDAFETSGQRHTVECSGRRDIVGCRGILGEKRGNAVSFVRFEKPIGKSRKVEKARDLILGNVSPAAPTPQIAI